MPDAFVYWSMLSHTKRLRERTGLTLSDLARMPSDWVDELCAVENAFTDWMIAKD